MMHGRVPRRIRLALFAATATTVLGGAPFASAASTATAADASQVSSSARDAKINQEIIGYQNDHPGDLAGLDKLVFHYTGRHVEVAGNGIRGVLNGVQAQPYIDAANKADARIDAAAAGRKVLVPAAGGIPAFSINVAAVPLVGPPYTMRITGSWQFPDAWAGQGSPVDEASLGFTALPTCMHQNAYSVNTYTYQMKSTNLGYLENANIGSSAPIWAVKDGEVGFVAQAGRGNVSVVLANYCGAKQQYGATFNYAANQGGSVTSVSASYGLLSVGYSNPGLTRNEGTPPLYFDN